MEFTKPMNSVTELVGRHNYAPSELAKDASPTTAGRQAVAAPDRTMPQASTRETERSASGENLFAAVTRLSDYVGSIQRTLDFSVDEDTGQTVVKVMDTETGEVIRQIPAEEILHMLKNLEASANGGSLDPKGIFVQDNA